VAFPPVDPTAEVLYAYDLGLFDKAGIDVTLTPLGNGAPSRPASRPARSISASAT